MHLLPLLLAVTRTSAAATLLHCHQQHCCGSNTGFSSGNMTAVVATLLPGCASHPPFPAIPPPAPCYTSSPPHPPSVPFPRSPSSQPNTIPHLSPSTPPHPTPPMFSPLHVHHPQLPQTPLPPTVPHLLFSLPPLRPLSLTFPRAWQKSSASNNC